MRTTPAFLLSTCLALSASLGAQNQMPFGNFQQGALNWKRTSFNDPLGTTGIGDALVTTAATSEALFASFKTLTPVMQATWRSSAFQLTSGSLSVSFNVMWDKITVTAPIRSPSVIASSWSWVT